MSDENEFEMFGQTPLVTPETWAKYVEENFVSAGFLEYVEGTVGVVKKIEEIVSVSQNFEELKNELTLFIQERKQFVKFAQDNLP